MRNLQLTTQLNREGCKGYLGDNAPEEILAAPLDQDTLAFPKRLSKFWARKISFGPVLPSCQVRVKLHEMHLVAGGHHTSERNQPAPTTGRTIPVGHRHKFPG